jgi:hypothetical protein
MGRADSGDAHSRINEWGGYAWIQPGAGGLGHTWATYISPRFFLFLVCLSFVLHFLYARDVEHFFILGAFGLLPLKKLCLVHLPLLHWVIDFWGVQFFEFPVYSGY